MRKYSKDIYSKEVLLKSAYAFTDVCYIHLDSDGGYYCVSLFSKEDETEELLFEKFENELIAQETRRVVSEKTKNIREMIVARSLASTIINNDGIEQLAEDNYNANDILIDWFENNE